tara:strand:- start:133 stop:405 length:273 start_codon:yes stop_codon:yes gene_type:complete
MDPIHAEFTTYLMIQEHDLLGALKEHPREDEITFAHLMEFVWGEEFYATSLLEDFIGRHGVDSDVVNEAKFCDFIIDKCPGMPEEGGGDD